MAWANLVKLLEQWQSSANSSHYCYVVVYLAALRGGIDFLCFGGNSFFFFLDLFLCSVCMYTCNQEASDSITDGCKPPCGIELRTSLQPRGSSLKGLKYEPWVQEEGSDYENNVPLGQAKSEAGTSCQRYRAFVSETPKRNPLLDWMAWVFSKGGAVRGAEICCLVSLIISVSLVLPVFWSSV